MIAVSDLTMRFGTQVLFEDVSWRLHPGTHYGLVGANGTGKTTLLKLLTGELRAEQGTISRPNALRIGVLEQDHFRYDDASLLEVVLSGKPRLWKALREKDALLARAGNGGEAQLNDAEGGRLGELEALIADNDGYTAEATAGTLLSGLGLAEPQHRQPMSTLSGGYRLRVLLARTLFQEPELLLLDEPTNHLDIVSILWLEGYLRGFPGTLVLASHDRHFLNAVCDHIADVDFQELRLYPGNYDRFVASKQLAQTQMEKEAARTEKKIAEMQQFIDRFRAKATKARQAQSRKKQVERMEMPEIKRTSRREPVFQFSPDRPSGREALSIKEVRKAFDGRTVLDNVGLELARGDKLAVVGPNGIGKTTLLKLIVGELKPDGGTIVPGYEVRMGYFSQDLQALTRSSGTVYDWLYAASPDKEIGAVRSTLGKVLFSGDDVKKPLGALSGGEATRLRLSGLMVRGANMLVLDEPTNHLDLEGREALMRALMAYTGTLIFVSHDRHFVSSVAGRVLALTPEGVEDFPGSYAEYLARQGEDYLTAQGAGSLAAQSDRQRKSPRAGLAYEQRKDRRREATRLRKQVTQLEKDIAGLEEQMARIDSRFAEKDYYDKTSWEQIDKDEGAKRELNAKLETAVAEWETSAGDLERLREAL